MIKFLSLDILGVSHKIPRKNKNAVYRLQIPAVVPEIFKFEKCINYANEMTDKYSCFSAISTLTERENKQRLQT